MLRFLVTFLLVFLFWIFLGKAEPVEVFAGLLVAFLAAAMGHDFLFRGNPKKLLKPGKLVSAFSYLFHFIYLEAASHMDVMSRVITGKIRPAFVRFPIKTRTETGKALIANTITINPGTLTVLDRDRNLYIHWIGYSKGNRSLEWLNKLAAEVAD